MSLKSISILASLFVTSMVWAGESNSLRLQPPKLPDIQETAEESPPTTEPLHLQPLQLPSINEVPTTDTANTADAGILSDADTPADGGTITSTDTLPRTIVPVPLAVPTTIPAPSVSVKQEVPVKSYWGRGIHRAQKEVVAPAAVPAVPQVYTGEPAPVAAKPQLSLLGLQLDIGIPDGGNVSAVVRPLKWVRLALGGGYNGLGPGWRGGLTLLPFGWGPSGTIEYGQYADRDINSFVRGFKSSFNGSPLLERFGYDYTNLQLGWDFGFHRAVFFIHCGWTWLTSDIHNVDQAVKDNLKSNKGTFGTTTVTVPRDPQVKLSFPSLKLGLIVYIW
jgi:hypothetical protein